VSEEMSTSTWADVGGSVVVCCHLGIQCRHLQQIDKEAKTEFIIPKSRTSGCGKTYNLIFVKLINEKVEI
jgi:hypothetical protein